MPCRRSTKPRSKGIPRGSGEAHPELDAIRQEVDEEAAKLRECLIENEELQETLDIRNEDEEEVEWQLSELRAEVEEAQEANEGNAEHRDRHEHVKSLRRRSVIAREEVGDMRSSSAARDVELAALRFRVEEGAAWRDEWHECEAATERIHVEASSAQRTLVAAELWKKEALDAAQRNHDRRVSGEAQLQQLKEDLQEAQDAAQRMQDSYWDDAPFLQASADVVMGYEAEIAESTEIAAEIQQALAQEHLLHEGAMQDAREAAVLGDDVDMLSPMGEAMTLQAGFACRGALSPMGEPITLHAGTPQADNICAVAAEAVPALCLSPPSLLLQRTPSSPSRPQSPVQAALFALDSENERLRQKVFELRGQVEAAALSGAVGPQPGHNTSFDSAVAGTGARVVDQMKQALHDDVALLRSLHQVKQELDKERRRERKTHAALERRLAAVPAVSRASPKAASASKPAGAGSVVHSF